MIRLKMKNHNIILTEKQRKYHHYHHVKLININTFTAKISSSNQVQMIEQANFIYFPLVKGLSWWFTAFKPF